jgi:hypothetical protein
MGLFQLLQTHPLVSLAQTAFMVWMLVDAYRRRAEVFWYYIILILPGVGAWVYFFVVKFGDFRRGGFATAPLFQRRESLDELRYRATETPTLANHLALAQRLIEVRQHAEAVPHLESVLKREPDHATASHCLAVCRLAEGKAAEAVTLLEKLTAREPRWSDYAAWLTLIEAKAAVADGEGAVAACRELVRLAPTMQHHCLLAEHLLATGHADEARGLLEKCLQDHAYAPGPVRRRDRRWAGEAKRLKKQITAADLRR